MKMAFAKRREWALTMIELLVIIAVVVVLAAIIVPSTTTKSKARASRIQCVDNLKQIGLAERIWEGDHGNLYPPEVSETNGGMMEFTSKLNSFRYIQFMSNKLGTPKLLWCPLDSARFPANTFNARPPPGEVPFLSNSNISYFVGLDANESDPESILMGDRNITNGTSLRNGILELTPNHPAGWTSEMHNRVGNIVLADGSLEELSISGLQNSSIGVGETNRLLMPVLDH